MMQSRLRSTVPQVRKHLRRIPASLAAATLGTALLLAAAAPVSAATTSIAPAASATTAARSTPDTPAAYAWVHIHTYNTYKACNTVGQTYEANGQYIPYKCVEHTSGAYFVWWLSILVYV
jgi:ribulose kinase